MFGMWFMSNGTAFDVKVRKGGETTRKRMSDDEPYL